MLGLTVVFALVQAVWLSSKMPAEDAAQSGKSP
jgi:hypothetical protein